MFFSVIRASNQVVPKNKVVDFLVLYNFYFDQISGFNMKFGVLGGQTLDKINSNKVNRGYCAPLFSLCVPMPRPPVVAGDGTRRPSAILGFRVDAFLSFPRPYPFRSVPFFLERAEHPSNPSRRRSPRRCRFRPSSPPCLDSPRPEPRSIAPNLLRPISSSLELHAGRIKPATAGRH